MKGFIDIEKFFSVNSHETDFPVTDFLRCGIFEVPTLWAFACAKFAKARGPLEPLGKALGLEGEVRGGPPSCPHLAFLTFPLIKTFGM